MKVTSKIAFYSLLGALAVVTVAVAFMLYWSNTQLENRSASIETKRALAAELDAKTTAATKLKDELQKNSELIGVAKDVLPGSKSQENIVGELIDIAANRGLKLESIAFSGGQNISDPETSQTDLVDGMPGVFSLGLNTSIETDYENALRFLEDLENNKRQFEVTNLSINPVEGDLFTVTLTIVTYIKP